jgi:mannose-6-phosphate isomerase-like protein (cupin superfamily)
MERRNFLGAAGLLAGFAALPEIAKAHSIWDETPAATPTQALLLPPMPPLDHKGSMDIRVWLRSSMTGGVYSCVECAVAPKTMGPAPHYHKALDELMFVLEGTAGVMVEGEHVEVPAGAWHLRPRKLTHTFWNASDKPLRFIDMYFNQPFEEFLEQVFFEYTPEKGYPFGSKERDAVMSKLNKKFGLVYAPDAGKQRQVIAEKYGLK